MKRKMAVLSMMLLFVGTGIHAYAQNGDHVYVTIDKGMSTVDSRSAIWNPQGKMTLEGVNKNSSKNDLNVYSMKQRNYLPDSSQASFSLNPGESKEKSYSSDPGEKYYVRLTNSWWALMRACNGRGDLYD